MTKLVIKTFTGKEIEIPVIGKINIQQIAGEIIYFANGESFPSEIVVEIKDGV